MAWFRCFVRGENFPGALIGEVSPVGFYTNRFVESRDALEAARRALEVVLAEPKLAMPNGGGIASKLVVEKTGARRFGGPFTGLLAVLL